jgi:hypothetical protein
VLRDKGPLRLHRLAEARGLRIPAAGSEHEARAAALAARRCVGCSSHGACDRMLEARDLAGLRGICPNAEYLDRLGK